MKTRFHHDEDGWTLDGSKITDPRVVELLRRCLENDGPIVVEHWFYRGSSAPHRMIFNELAEFQDYLESQAFAGDAIHIWSFGAVCRSDNCLASGKCPDDGGCIPARGAY